MQQPPAAPTPPVAPNAPVAVDIGNGQTINVPAGSTASAVYEALRDQRSELRNQLDRLEERRGEFERSLTREGEGALTAESRAGVVDRLKEVDARIKAVDAQLAQADAAVARAAAVPGAVQPPVEHNEVEWDVVFGVGSAMTFALLFPLMVAYARRLWKRGAIVVAPVPQDVRDRLNELSTAVDSIGLEVERIGEGQRFMTKLFSDQQGRARIETPRQG